MEKKLTPQIAAMYLGCEVETINGRGSLFEINTDKFCLVEHEEGRSSFFISDISLILRPLSDMTEDEAKAIYSIRYPLEEFEGKNALYGFWHDKDEWYVETRFILTGEPQVWAYLLSRGFDLFGLIESGEAIYTTTLK